MTSALVPCGVASLRFLRLLTKHLDESLSSLFHVCSVAYLMPSACATRPMVTVGKSLSGPMLDNAASAMAERWMRSLVLQEAPSFSLRRSPRTTALCTSASFGVTPCITVCRMGRMSAWSRKSRSRHAALCSCPLHAFSNSFSSVIFASLRRLAEPPNGRAPGLAA